MIDTIKSRTVTKRVVVDLSEVMMIVTSNVISRVAFGKRPYVYDDEGQKEVKTFHKLLLDSQASFVNFYYRDYFPLMGWLDKLNGTIGRLEKNFNHLDEFYQELIDEHLNRNRPNKMQDDMVDILLRLKQDSDSNIDLTFDHIKAVLMNILFGGTDTSAATVVWAMTLLIQNPETLKKVQQEVRNVIGNKGKVQEDDLQNLNYLKAFIPFGSGRRGCPGMSLGVATVELTLSNLVYAFDWELPDGEKDIDTLATLGIVSHKKNPLRLVAKVYDYGLQELMT
ncbi:hypothetical protein L6452_34191 [Arctium lappa]|uniref:Uncharacterized protein n=2 Tax=Arctium lappa TaxID=4217 RepID=A0ACB8YGT2_ARCLA|nr:hypothetical protein L6452_34189 [Arctium lappa]KAI3684961.1 hypothetical protein L6452_34191 [Arctium lappa]